MQLEGRSAIVTGSTKGIGFAVSEALLGQGANVVVSARNQAEVEGAVKALSSKGSGRVAGRTCDVRVEDEVRELVSYAVSEFGGLDILVNNAGIGRFARVEEMSAEHWRQTIETNLNSLFYASHYAIPHLKMGDGGFILNIGSLAGKNAFPTGAAYNASKFGLIGFSEALMQEVRHDGIQVAYIMPGSVDTWFGGTPPVGEDSWKMKAEDVAQVVVETLSRSATCLTSRIEMRPPRPPKK